MRIISALLIFAISSSAVFGADNAKKNILVISSFSEATYWGKSIIEGLRSAVSPHEHNLVIEATETWERIGEYYSKEDLDKVLKHFEKNVFDVIVAIDPPAMNMILANKEKFPLSAKMIFVGVMGEDPQPVIDDPNITSIKFPLAVEGNINIGMKMFPDTKRIVFITDASEDGLLEENYVRSIVDNLKAQNYGVLPQYNMGVARADIGKVEVSYLNGRDLSTAEILAKLKAFNANKDEPLFAIFYGWGSTKDHDMKSQPEYAKMFSAAVDGKFIVFFEDSKDFAIGGYMTNGVLHGAFIAQKAKDLVDNNLAIDPYEAMSVISLKINWKLFTDMHLKVDSMPSFTSYYELEPSFWDLVDYRIVAAVSSLVALMALACLLLSYRAMILSKRNAILFESIPSNIHVFFGNGTIYYSYSAEDTNEKIKSIFDLGNEFKEAYESNLEKIKRGQSVSIEYDYKKQRRKAVVAKIKQDIFGDNAYIASTVDITEIEKLNKSLQKAMEAARESEKAKSYFLATMSHELRTPLNAVIGYSEITQDESLTPKERAANLRNIHFAANTLLNLINDILDLSKLEAGQMEIFKAPVDVMSVAKEFANIFKFSAEKKNIYLECAVQSEIPVLMMDILRLRQILMNVIGNAIKFTKEGGISVSFDFEKQSDKSGNLCISVKDTGIGIAKKNINKIFNAFEQDNDQRIRGYASYEGTGLALTIVKRLLERMNGTVCLESELGKGSTFTFCFKDVEISDTPIENIAKKQTPEATFDAGADTLDLNVLIVDDIDLNIMVLEKMLSKMGVRTASCLSAADAFEAIKKTKPDIIMTDVWMPQINGEEFALALKANPETSDITIIAVTADSQLAGETYGAFDDVLLKPITMQRVHAILKAHAKKQI